MEAAWIDEKNQSRRFIGGILMAVSTVTVINIASIQQEFFESIQLIAIQHKFFINPASTCSIE